MNSPSLPVSLVDASNELTNRGRPLSKVQDTLPPLQPFSAVQGRAGAYGETTRVHRSIAVSDSGESFFMGRIASEQYPISGPLCDLRGPYQVVGESARWEGRTPIIYEK